MTTAFQFEATTGATLSNDKLSPNLLKLIDNLSHPVYSEDDDTETPIAIAPCDIGPDDVLTFDFTAPLTGRIVKVERDGVVIYEANK